MVIVSTNATLQFGKVVFRAGLLGHAVNRTTGSTTAGKGRAGALGDFNLFGRKTFPRGHARIAQTIHEHVTARFLPANDVAITEGVTVFTSSDRHARLHLQDFFQIGAAGILNLGFGNHVDRLRCFCQRFHMTLITRYTCLVRCTRFCIGIGIDGAIFNLQRIELDGLVFFRHDQRAQHERRYTQCQCTFVGERSGLFHWRAQAQRAQYVLGRVRHD